MHSSDTALVEAPALVTTGIFLFAAASRSMLSKPTPALPMHLNDGACSIRAAVRVVALRTMTPSALDKASCNDRSFSSSILAPRSASRSNPQGARPSVTSTVGVRALQAAASPRSARVARCIAVLGFARAGGVDRLPALVLSLPERLICEQSVQSRTACQRALLQKHRCKQSKARHRSRRLLFESYESPVTLYNAERAAGANSTACSTAGCPPGSAAAPKHRHRKKACRRASRRPSPSSF